MRQPCMAPRCLPLRQPPLRTPSTAPLLHLQRCVTSIQAHLQMSAKYIRQSGKVLIRNLCLRRGLMYSCVVRPMHEGGCNLSERSIQVTSCLHASLKASAEAWGCVHAGERRCTCRGGEEEQEIPRRSPKSQEEGCLGHGQPRPGLRHFGLRPGDDIVTPGLCAPEDDTCGQCVTAQPARHTSAVKCSAKHPCE